MPGEGAAVGCEDGSDGAGANVGMRNTAGGLGAVAIHVGIAVG